MAGNFVNFGGRGEVKEKNLSTTKFWLLKSTVVGLIL